MFQLAVVAFAQQPSVMTPCGEVLGVYESLNGVQLAAFKGIRYGAPPERWQPPLAPSCFSAPLNATEFGNVCYQDPTVGPMFGTMSEDCLFLNVYRPSSPPSGPLPVVVWIHGGSLVVGAAQHMYGSVQYLATPGALTPRGAVVVSLNYRLGALGWMATPLLAAADQRGVAGMYGLLDQQLALAWVQENIAAYGGDPASVTLLGQSSGGTSILLHLMAPLSKGLFSAAISLSASANITMSKETKYAYDVAHWQDNTPCVGPNATLDCLVALPAAAVVAALDARYDTSPRISNDFPTDGPPHSIGWAPLVFVDGVTIPSADWVVDVPTILQSLAAEAAVEIDGYYDTPNFTVDAFGDYAASRFSTFPRARTDKLVSSYTTGRDASAAIYAAVADTSVACPTMALAFSQGAGRQTALYVSYVASGPAAGVLRRDAKFRCTAATRLPYHAWDYTSATRTWGDCLMACPYDPSPPDLLFGDNVRASWAALIANGSVPQWLPPPGLNVFVGGGVMPTPMGNQPQCEMWESFGVGMEWAWIN